MLTQKIDQKKNLIYGSVLAVILIIVAVLLLRSYFFTGNSKEESSLYYQTDFKALDMPAKKFDSGFLRDSRYTGLRDNSVKIKDIEDLKIGKKNPFAKENIKNEDEGFYERVFKYKEENNKSNVIVKGCWFPEKIGEYSRQDVSSPSWKKEVLYYEIGFYSITETLTIYSSTAQIEVLSFVDQDSAKYFFNDLTKENFEDCEIDDVKGLCYLHISGIDGRIVGAGKFFWLESELVKTVFSSSELKKGNGDLVEIVKENLAPFVSQFKNCKVDIVKK